MKFEIWHLLLGIMFMISAYQTVESKSKLSSTIDEIIGYNSLINSKPAFLHSRLTNNFDPRIIRMRSDPDFQRSQQFLTTLKMDGNIKEHPLKELLSETIFSNEKSIKPAIQSEKDMQNDQLIYRTNSAEMNRAHNIDFNSIHSVNDRQTNQLSFALSSNGLATEIGPSLMDVSKKKTNFFDHILTNMSEIPSANLGFDDESSVEVTNGSPKILLKSKFHSFSYKNNQDRDLTTEAVEQKLNRGTERLLNLNEELQTKNAKFVKEKTKLYQFIQSYNSASVRIHEMRRNMEVVKKTYTSENRDYQNYFNHFKKFVLDREQKRNYLKNEYRKNQVLHQMLIETESQLKNKNQFMEAQIKELYQKKNEVIAINDQLKQQKQKLINENVHFENHYQELQNNFKQLSGQKEALSAVKTALETSKETLEKQIEGFQDTQKRGDFLRNQIDQTKKEIENEQIQLTEVKQAYNKKLEELIEKLKELEKFKEIFQHKQCSFTTKNANVSFYRRKVNEKQLLLNRKEKILERRVVDLKEKQRICKCDGQISEFYDHKPASNSIAFTDAKAPWNNLLVFTSKNSQDQNSASRNLSGTEEYYPSHNPSNTTQQTSYSASSSHCPLKGQIQLKMMEKQGPRVDIFKDPYFSQKKFFSA